MDHCASHEIIEMLIDPNGNRTQTSQAITIDGDNVVDADGTFDYLVEACDPCEADNFAYEIGGVAVSDFITPDFYDPTVLPGVQYSFMGNVTRPRQLLEGGYISYIGSDGQWRQILWVDPTAPPQYNNLSVASGCGPGARQSMPPWASKPLASSSRRATSRLVLELKCAAASTSTTRAIASSMKRP